MAPWPAGLSGLVWGVWDPHTAVRLRVLSSASQVIWKVQVLWQMHTKRSANFCEDILEGRTCLAQCNRSMTQKMPTRQELPEKVWRLLALGCCNGVVGRGNSCDLGFAGREKPELKKNGILVVLERSHKKPFWGWSCSGGVGTILFFQDL